MLKNDENRMLACSTRKSDVSRLFSGENDWQGNPQWEVARASQPMDDANNCVAKQSQPKYEKALKRKK